MAPLNLSSPHTFFCTEQRRSERDLDEMGPEKKSGEGMGVEGKRLSKAACAAGVEGKWFGGGEGCNIGFGSLALIGRLLLLCAAHRGWLVWWWGKKRGGFQKRVFGRWGEGRGREKDVISDVSLGGLSLSLPPFPRVWSKKARWGIHQ